MSLCGIFSETFPTLCSDESRLETLNEKSRFSNCNARLERHAPFQPFVPTKLRSSLLRKILLNFDGLLQALRDLADPAEGVYNATALLETRLSYVCNMLDKYQKLPSSRPIHNGGPSASVALTAPEEVSGSTLLSSVVTAIKNVASGEEHEVVEDKRQVQCL